MKTLHKISLAFFIAFFSILQTYGQNSVTTSAGNAVYDIDAPASVVIDPNIVVTATTDIDNAIVIISGGFIPAEDELVYPATLYGVTGTYNNTTGVLALSGTATPAEYQDIFRTIEYNNTSATPTETTRQITFSLGDALPFYPCGQTEPHFYKMITSYANDWIGARNDAQSQTYFGYEGYLATIICQEENDFITEKLDASAFIGASDASSEGVWQWVTGPEAGTTFWNNGTTLTYANWNSNGEPNNTAAEEHYACIYGLSHPVWGETGYWNDIRQFPEAGDQIAGYVLEFGGMPGDPTQTLADNRDVLVTSSLQADLTVSGSTVCEGSDATVTIQATQNGVEYEAFIGVTSVGSETGDGGNISITISNSELSIGNNTVTFTADNGATTVNLTNSATVVVNANPITNLTVSGNNICEGDDGTVTIQTSENGVSYEAFLGATSVATGTGTGNDLDFTISSANLSVGDNTITFTADNGCPANLDNSAIVTVTANPADLSVNGSTICEGNAGTATIQSSENGVSYEAFINGTSIGTQTGNGNDLQFTISNANLSGGTTVTFVATNGSCVTNFTNSANISITANPLTDRTVAGCEICVGEDGTITIENSENGITYEAFLDGSSIGTGTGNGANLEFTVPQSNLQNGENTLTFEATNNGCMVALVNPATVTVNGFELTTINSEGSEVTLGEDGIITLVETENTLTYEIHPSQSDSTITSITASGENDVATVSADYLQIGDNPFDIYAVNKTCKLLVGDEVIVVTSEVNIPTGFSPNGNGINDTYIIDGIEDYPNNSVQIFNRWGNLVYQASGYNNSTTVWDGKSTNALNVGNGYLPEGTYFFVVELGDDTDVYKGSLYLKH